jgi:PAS domain S-box-containing protein
MLLTPDILTSRILIVDDIAPNVALLEQILHGAGYVGVTATRDPYEVCALHRRNHYDLIILDLRMPGLDGFQVMAGLKEVEAEGYPPVLAITAEPDHKLAALKAGARDFIGKPFNLAEILLRVRNLLEVRRLHRNENVYNQGRLENSQRIAVLGDWDYDFVHHRLVWSDEVYRILGLPPQDFPAGSETFYRRVHPEDLAFVHREKKAVADGFRRVEFEHRIIRPDGVVRHLRQVAEMFFDDQGRPLRESGTIQDITERKAAGEALRESEERYRKMVMLSPDAHLVLVDGLITFVNAAFCRLLGAADPTCFIGRPAIEVVHPDYQEFVRELQAKLGRDLPVPPSEVKFIRLDARPVDVEVACVAFEFRGHREVQIAARDISASKAAALALQESEQRFRFVARAVSDVVWDWNLQADTLWWNDGFLTTFGFAVGEIEASVEFWSGRVHPEDRSRVLASIDTAIGDGSEAWSAEYRFQRKDGSYAFVQDRGFIVRDASGQGVRMVGGMRDLTEQRKMESQYLRAQRMESIGTLAGGIAHDLNNVLAPIMMAVELLKSETGDDPRRRKILDAIHVSSRRGADLVRQVLSFARGLDGDRVVLRLRSLLDDLASIISETFPRSIRITMQAPADLWPVVGDATQLHQVLLNLAVNARDAMPHGGALTLTASNVTIDEQYAGTSPEAKTGAYVLLQVADTGMGIPPEVRERIFEPFFTTKEFGHGTGIGLTTVHTIVKGHGGFLKVESEVGRGTTFQVYRPADPSTSAAEPVIPLPCEVPRGGNELVLVIDDEPAIRDITRQTLQGYGYRVLTASDGPEGIALYAQQQAEIAVVLTDMMMPLMDGTATIQVLTRINPAVRIIAASGLAAAENVARATAAGARDFLAKPFTAQTLRQMVRTVIDRPRLPLAR